MFGISLMFGSIPLILWGLYFRAGYNPLRFILAQYILPKCYFSALQLASGAATNRNTGSQSVSSFSKSASWLTSLKKQIRKAGLSMLINNVFISQQCWVIQSSVELCKVETFRFCHEEWTGFFADSCLEYVHYIIYSCDQNTWKKLIVKPHIHAGG